MKPCALLAAVGISLAFLPSTAQAQWWNRNDITPPKDRGTPQEMKPQYNRQLQDSAQGAIWQFLQSEDYAKVDRMHDEFMRDQRRTEDGVVMLDAFRRALDSLFLVYDEAELQRRLADWRVKSPDSRLLPVAEAHMWEALAWKARSRADYSDVSPEGKSLFQERLRKASRALEASAGVGKDNPLWYWVALIVAGSTSRPQAQFDGLYNEAVTKFPAYLPLYYTRVNYLLPQWGGDWDQVERFVADAVDRTRATEGTALYAWIYADMNRKIGGQLFEVTKAQWPVMRASFEDLIKRYPDKWNRMLYATFACLARDKETTARLLQDMPGDVIFAGYAHVSSDGCRRFAFDRT